MVFKFRIRGRKSLRHDFVGKLAPVSSPVDRTNDAIIEIIKTITDRISKDQVVKLFVTMHRKMRIVWGM